MSNWKYLIDRLESEHDLTDEEMKALFEALKEIVK